MIKLSRAIKVESGANNFSLSQECVIMLEQRGNADARAPIATQQHANKL